MTNEYILFVNLTPINRNLVWVLPDSWPLTPDKLLEHMVMDKMHARARYDTGFEYLLFDSFLIGDLEQHLQGNRLRAALGKVGCV